MHGVYSCPSPRLDQLIEEMNKEGDYSNKKLLQDLREVAQQLKVIPLSFQYVCIR